MGTVRQAKEALKPAEVQNAQVRERVSTGDRERRRNAAYVRQGEWFFLPMPGLVVPFTTFTVLYFVLFLVVVHLMRRQVFHSPYIPEDPHGRR